MSVWYNGGKAFPCVRDANGRVQVTDMVNSEELAQDKPADMEAVDLGSAQQPAEKTPQVNSQRYAPEPGTIPVALAEHEDLHTYVQRARNISLFSIVFTLACAGVGLGFAWTTSRCASTSAVASWVPEPTGVSLTFIPRCSHIDGFYVQLCFAGIRS